MFNLGRLLRFWRISAPGSQSSHRPLAPSHETAQAFRRDAFDTVLQTLKDRPDGGAGRVRVISLTDFRDAVGDKWPRLTDKVAMIADRLIRAGMGGNPYRRIDEDLWLLLFPRLPPDQARMVTLAIVQDISRHLLGDSCVGGTRPLAVAAHVDSRQALNDQGDLSPDTIRRAVEQCRSILDNTGPRPDACHICPDNAGPTGGKCLSTAMPRRTHSSAEWVPIIMEHAEKQPQEPWQAVPPLPSDAHLSLLWRPTWVAEREAIAAYCARIARVDHPGAPPLEGPMAYPVNDPASAENLDRFVARTAIRDVLRGGASAGTAILPLTWTSLQGDNRADLMFPFADVPAAIRQHRLKVEICRVPDDAEPDEVRLVVDALRPLCGEVLLRLRLSSPLLCRVDELGDAKIGLDLSELRPNERMSDDRLLSLLDLLQDSTRQAGLGCYVWSARRRRLVGGAVSSGFDMVNGPGLMKDVGRPAMVMPAPRERFQI